MFYVLLYFTALPYTALYLSVLLCTAMYCSVLLYTALYCSVLLCTALYYSVLLYCSVLLCTARHYSPHSQSTVTVTWHDITHLYWEWNERTLTLLYYFVSIDPDNLRQRYCIIPVRCKLNSLLPKIYFNARNHWNVWSYTFRQLIDT